MAYSFLLSLGYNSLFIFLISNIYIMLDIQMKSHVVSIKEISKYFFH